MRPVRRHDKLELKIALAILKMNTATRSPHNRIISSSKLIQCWREVPPGSFLETVKRRITQKSKRDRFDALIHRAEEIQITYGSTEVEAMLNGASSQRPQLVGIARARQFRTLVSNAVTGPRDLVGGRSAVSMRTTHTVRGGASHTRKHVVIHGAKNPAPPERKYSEYKVFFGTDRYLQSKQPVKFIGKRSEDGIHYGVARVSVPAVHKEGKIERPRLLFRLLPENPDKYIVTHSKLVMSEHEWIETLRTRLASSIKDIQKEGLLFIHGYNVALDEALWRSVQLCHDLNFEGQMLCFSWASKGRTAAYTVDEATVEWSVANLKEYLTTVTQKLGLSELHIVAHSMGNRALLSVLENWKNKPGATPIKQIILAAPDVDAHRFLQIGKVFDAYEQVTLYASRNDRAIVASKTVHSYPRAGGANPPLVMEHLSTIDVSSAGKDMFGLGHFYVAEVSKVFRDLFYIVRHRHKPDQRAGMKKRNEGYWVLE